MALTEQASAVETPKLGVSTALTIRLSFAFAGLHPVRDVSLGRNVSHNTSLHPVRVASTTGCRLTVGARLLPSVAIRMDCRCASGRGIVFVRALVAGAFYLSPERRIPLGCSLTSANATCRVNPVETRFIASSLSQSRRVNAVETHGRASLQMQTQLQTQTAPVSVSHDTPPAPSPEGKGEAVDATEEGARYTYIYCFSKSRLPSLVERGWGRGAMPSDTAAGIRLPSPLWRGGRGCVTCNYEL
ncbi:MAG: hypothetical protein LBD27_04530 [Tannerella sp.]|nr:hypothetical protein [Tannerella sp.]